MIQPLNPTSQEKVANLTIKMSNGETLSLIPTGPVRHYYYGFSPIFVRTILDIVILEEERKM